jgi:2'-5' RNA ligase
MTSTIANPIPVPEHGCTAAAMPRLFAAISIPSATGQGLQACQSAIADARWHPLDALHITLRFFGDVQGDAVGQLADELAAVRFDPMPLDLAGVGKFGSGRKIHAVWAAVVSNPQLRRLATDCEAVARRAGLPAEARAYLPHVTLAYLNRPDPVQVDHWIDRHRQMHCPAFEVSGFSLYSSQSGTVEPSGSAGPVYRQVREFSSRDPG